MINIRCITVLALMVGPVYESLAQEYGLPLQAKIEKSEMLDSSLASSDGSDRIERLSRYAERSGTRSGYAGLEAMAAGEEKQARITVSFDTLPQRALPPRLILNGRVIGIPDGDARPNGDGLVMDFIVLPSSAADTGSSNEDGAEAAPLIVQLGDDTRTAAELSTDEPSRTVLESLGFVIARP